MSQTLLISDLHLGHPSGLAVLERPAPLERLLSAIEQADRLVLLGDIIELRNSDAPEAMSRAEPVLRAVGRLPGSRELLLIPGNHDRMLIRDWIAARGQELEPDDRAPNDASAALSEVNAWLGGQLQVRYPGAALSPSVWATHGHYLDPLLTPQGPYGFTALGGRRHSARRRAAWYERERPHRTSRMAHVTYHQIREARVSRLMSRALGGQMRAHSVPALRSVIASLGVQAAHVVFGHVHRLGPLGREHWGEFANTGSWYYEPLLVDHAVHENPYWPGGAVWLSDDDTPRPVNLLAGLERHELLPRVR
ncbi:MAG: metallophosphoesterase family protein [Solirubrobacterales bacterium]|nr:metallophosphoesterase family protein [Solirubrobacterales bacterium]